MHGKLKILTLCLLLSAPLWGQSGTIRNIPVQYAAENISCSGVTGYSNTYTMTIDVHTIGLGADVTNWPIRFAGNAALAAFPTGVSLSTGVDVVFCSSENGGTVLTYELVPNTYNATTGAGEWWINVPTISHSATTKIAIFAGKVSATDKSCNTGGSAHCGTALFPNCLLVNHMGGYNGTTGSYTQVDSCGGSSATNHSSTGGSAIISVTPPILEFGQFASQFYDSGETPGANIASFTYEMLIANNDSGTNRFIVGNVSTQAGNPGIDAYMLTGGSCSGTNKCVDFGIFTSTGNNSSNLVNADFGNAGSAWHHYAATHATGATGSILAYIDGVSQTVITSRTGSPVDPGNSNSTFHVGDCGSDCAGLTNWAGNLDEVRLSSVVETSDQILFNYTTFSNPTSTYSVASP